MDSKDYCTGKDINCVPYVVMFTLYLFVSICINLTCERSVPLDCPSV